MVGVVDQKGAAQAAGGLGGDRGIGAGEQLDQGAHVVAADHGGQQSGGLQGAHQGAGGRALGHATEPARLDVGRFIHARRDAFAQKVEQEGLFAGGGLLQQLGQGLRLGGGQRQGRHAEGFPGRGGLPVGGQQLGGRQGSGARGGGHMGVAPGRIPGR